jgi:hypothetical protein
VRYFWNGLGGADPTLPASALIEHGGSGTYYLDFGTQLGADEPRGVDDAGAQTVGSKWAWSAICNAAMEVGVVVADAADFEVVISNCYLRLEDVKVVGQVLRPTFARPQRLFWGVQLPSEITRYLASWKSLAAEAGGALKENTSAVRVLARGDGMECQGNLSSGLGSPNVLIEAPTDIIESLLKDFMGRDGVDASGDDLYVNDRAAGSGYSSFPQAATDQATIGTWKGNLYVGKRTPGKDILATLATELCLNLWWGADGRCSVSHFLSSKTSRQSFTTANMAPNPEIGLTPISEIVTGVVINYRYDYGREEYGARTYVKAEKRNAGSLLDGALTAIATSVKVDDTDDFYLESGTDGATDATGLIFTSATAKFRSCGVRPGDLVVRNAAPNETASVSTVDSEIQITLAGAITGNLAAQTYYVLQPYILIDREIAQVTNCQPAAELLTVTRAACGTTANTHADNTAIEIIWADSDDGTGTRDQNAAAPEDRETDALLAAAKYGVINTVTLDCDCLRDDTTAVYARNHRVDYFYRQRPTIRFRTSLCAAHLEIHDLITITHSLLPATATGQKFEILDLVDRPSAGNPMEAIEIFGRQV